MFAVAICELIGAISCAVIKIIDIINRLSLRISLLSLLSSLSQLILAAFSTTKYATFLHRLCYLLCFILYKCRLYNDGLWCHWLDAEKVFRPQKFQIRAAGAGNKMRSEK